MTPNRLNPTNKLNQPSSFSGVKETELHRQIHLKSDLDSGKQAQHHTLGKSPQQAAAGNHTHQDSWLFVSILDFGAKGDDVHDDTAATVAFYAYLAENGGNGWVPSGDYILTARIKVEYNAQPFSVSGAGMFASTFKRRGEYGQAIVFENCTGVNFNNIGIDGGSTEFPTNASHALVAYETSHSRFRDIFVFNYRNSGIIVYAAAPGGTARNTCVEDSYALGNGVTSGNGILISYMVDSYIRRCIGENIRQASPGTGLQMKNNCDKSGIESGLSINCDGGFSFSSDTPGTGPRRSISFGLKAIGCKSGVAVGGGFNGIIDDVLVDMLNDATATVGFKIEDDAYDVNVGRVHILNVPEGATALQMDGKGSTIDVDYLEDLGTSGAPLVFGTVSDNNLVTIKKILKGGVPVVGDTSGLVNYTTTIGNAVRLLGQQHIIALTPVSDVLTIPDKSIEVVNVGTEGATGTDDVTSIVGGQPGQRITFYTRANTQDVTFVHGSNIRLAGGTNMVLDNRVDSLTLFYNPNSNQWCEIARSANI